MIAPITWYSNTLAMRNAMVPVVVTVIGHQCDKWKKPYRTMLKMNLKLE